MLPHGTPLFTSVGIPDRGHLYYMVVTLTCSQSGLNSRRYLRHMAALLNIRCPLNSCALGAGVTLFLVSRFLCFPSTLHPPQVPPLRCASSISLPTILDSSCWHSVSYWKPAIHISSAPLLWEPFPSSLRGAHSSFPGPHLRFAPDDPRPLRVLPPFSYQKSAPSSGHFFYLGLRIAQLSELPPSIDGSTTPEPDSGRPPAWI